ncbi:MAG TPA: enoyl-CoA hydratase/isomerase family protein [candidate division Zixibacteria bacterium]|nr:enoyl-CoA hydratase/isomerase family protein [candidate division Zixibacteria bacterium]
MAGPIIQKKDADVTTLILNRPDVGNRQSDAALAELTAMIASAAKESRAIVLKGAGEDFCLGREAMGRPGPVMEAYSVRERSDVIFALYGAFRDAPIPIVGAVQGRAAGLGCALAALCDITIASERARFQLPEMAHNIMPTIAMSALVDRLPRKAVAYLVYSTREIDARTALSFGLVSEVVAPADLDGSIDDLIGRMRQMPLPALLAVKEYARSAFSMSTQAANDFARNLHATVNSFSGMRAPASGR